MSLENVEVVRREYVALAARDWAALAEVWHPDIEVEALETEPEAGTYRASKRSRDTSRLGPSHTRSTGSKPTK
jgi:ketosteroid isomerase-like protein